MNISLNVFPSEVLNQNINAIDWSTYDILAFASGQTLHFFYYHNNSLTRLYSTDFHGGTISCIAFHQNNRQIAVGNSKGTVFLWDIDSRQCIGYYDLLTPACCYSLKWYQSSLLAIFDNKRLACFIYCKNYRLEKLPKNFNLRVMWVLNLSFNCLHLSVTHYHGTEVLYLLSGEKHFSIFHSNGFQELSVSFWLPSPF